VIGLARIFWLVPPLAAAACTSPVVLAPSLAPRSAEAIDPRLPIPPAPPAAPAGAALRARLAELVAQARAGDQAFASAAAEAERLAAVAGEAQSESWIAAQQALSLAVAARGQTTRALGDIDEIAATALANRGGIAPGDLAAIEQAAAEAAAIDARGAARVEAIQARLGS